MPKQTADSIARKLRLKPIKVQMQFMVQVKPPYFDADIYYFQRIALFVWRWMGYTINYPREQELEYIAQARREYQRSKDLHQLDPEYIASARRQFELGLEYARSKKG